MVQHAPALVEGPIEVLEEVVESQGEQVPEGIGHQQVLQLGGNQMVGLVGQQDDEKIQNLDINDIGNPISQVVDQAIVNPDNNILQRQHLQLGMALIQSPDFDPVWVERNRNAEATRLWAAFFERGNDQSLLASIPAPWANFFTVMLMTPRLFEWAKSFLSSKAISCLGQHEGVIDFHIPNKFPKQICCISADNHGLRKEEGNKMPMEEMQKEPMTPPKKASAKRSCPLVETSLRRSDRIKQVHGGMDSKGGLALIGDV